MYYPTNKAVESAEYIFRRCTISQVFQIFWSIEITNNAMLLWCPVEERQNTALVIKNLGELIRLSGSPMWNNEQ